MRNTILLYNRIKSLDAEVGFWGALICLMVADAWQIKTIFTLWAIFEVFLGLRAAAAAERHLKRMEDELGATEQGG